VALLVHTRKTPLLVAGLRPNAAAFAADNDVLRLDRGPPAASATPAVLAILEVGAAGGLLAAAAIFEAAATLLAGRVVGGGTLIPAPSPWAATTTPEGRTPGKGRTCTVHSILRGELVPS
jgi:hypothetical protein